MFSVGDMATCEVRALFFEDKQRPLMCMSSWLCVNKHTTHSPDGRGPEVPDEMIQALACDWGPAVHSPFKHVHSNTHPKPKLVLHQEHNIKVTSTK